MSCPKNFTFIQGKLSEIRLIMNIEPAEVDQTNLTEESNVEVLDKGEQRKTRYTADNEVENVEDSIDEAFHTEFTANWVENEQLDRRKETAVNEILVLENTEERVTLNNDGLTLTAEC